LIEKENMNLPKWMRAKRAFEDVAQSYKINHNKPSVIIFDNVDRLINHSEIIDSLQDSAMKNAKHNKYITVFISTKGPVLERMECKCEGYLYS
jgi:Cdc6-like AAA superfamily ATPase